MPRSISAALSLLLLVVATLPAHAQEMPPVQPLADQPVPPLVDEPIAPFVVDARGVLARFKQFPAVAAGLAVPETELPTRGLGLVVGAHLYPVRTRSFALGVGAELLLRARGSNTIPPAVEGGPDGPTIVTRMTAFSPQVSLNFGRRNGWSYLSGGIGRSSFTTERDDAPLEDPETRPMTINYGGGARWFAKTHLAFSLDLRFYAIRPQEATTIRPAFPRMTVMIFSAGISVR